MADAKLDQNSRPTLIALSSANDGTIVQLWADPVTHRLLTDTAGGGSGTVTSFSFTDANGIAGVVTNATTTPNLTLSLGAITPTSVTASGLLRSNTGLVLEETGAGTDTITIQAPAAIAASYTLTLPVNDGANLEFLQTDGNGVLSWAAGGSGTVTTVSVATANGFAGSVANATTTPAITISTSVTGVMVGNGTAVAAAVSGTDVKTVNGTSILGSGDIVTPAGTVTSVSGTTNRITSTGGATPVIDISASYVGQASITTLGTIATGVWNGTVITGQYGGTGVANTGKTITVSGNTTIGSSTDTVAFVTGGNTSVTLPTTGTLATLAGTETFTNKRITRRVVTTNAPGATPSTDVGTTDVRNLTGLAANITSMTTNLSGTPTDGQLLEFRFTDDGTPRTIAWGASFADTTVVAPTTTVASTMLRVGFEWNGTIWQCVATC